MAFAAMLFLVILLSITRINANCLNHDGEPVDWWFIYRVPASVSSEIYVDIDEIHSQYAYYDSNTKEMEYLRVYGTEYKKFTKTTENIKQSTKPKKKIQKINQNNKRTKDSSEEIQQPTNKKRKTSKTTKKKDPDYVPPSEEESDEDIYRRRRLLNPHSGPTLSDTKNPLYRTFSPFFHEKSYKRMKPKWEGFAYSDDPPNDDRSPPSKYAHAKGTVLYNPTNNDGFWLIHSLPNYPDLSTEKYSYGTHEKQKKAKQESFIYGQTFLCISLQTVETRELAIHQIHAMHPNIYFIQTPQLQTTKGTSNQFLNAFMNTFALTSLSTFSTFNGIHPAQNSESCTVRKFTQPSFWSSRKVAQFTHYAKSYKYKQDVFACLTNGKHGMHYGFKFETWCRGCCQKSFCSSSHCTNCKYSYDLLNVNKIELKIGSGDDVISWGRTLDHAKIGCSIAPHWLVPNKHHYVCIGDMNRMYTQRKRGGGFMCIDDFNFWKVINRALVLNDGPPRCEQPY